MTSSSFGLMACGVCLAVGCGSVRIEDDGGGGQAAADTTAVTSTVGAQTTATTQSTNATSVTSAVTTGAGSGVAVEPLQTDTTNDLHAVLWDVNEDGTAIAGGDGRTVLRLRAGAAPVPMDQGLEGGPGLRISSLAQMGAQTFAGAFEGEGDRQWAHVLRFDDAWHLSWMPNTTCLNGPALKTFLGLLIATCDYYPWLGSLDENGLVHEVPDGFAHMATADWAKWAEVLASDGTDVFTLDPATLERSNAWHAAPGLQISGLLQDHRERRLAVTENGDVLELWIKGAVNVIYAGDGTALRAGTRVGQDATLFVGDAGKVVVMRGSNENVTFEVLDVGVTGGLHAIAARYGHDQAVTVGDGGVALVLTVQ